MVATLTPRVGYTLDASGQIDVQHANWDRADQVSGLIYTTKGVTPPNSVLYDGAVVVEKDTGISYRMIKNGAVFDKHYVNYPFSCAVWEVAGQVNPGFNQEWGWATTDDKYNTNYDSTWKEAGTNAFIAKVKALYSMKIEFYWGSGANSAGFTNLLGSFSLNGVRQTNYDYPKLCNPNWAGNSGSMPFSIAGRYVFNVGDKIRPWMNNVSGSGKTFTTVAFFSIIRPVF